VTYQWVDCDPAFIARRYDRFAGLIGLFDLLLFLPQHLRGRAVARLNLKPGERVLEIGCGTGRNFPFLREAVGPTGTVYGVDLSSGMLRRARERCQREGWTNVELTQCDAIEYIPCEPLDGIIFGLCYNTMPHHLAVLRHAWKHLRPGGRIVIMDGKLPYGRGGKLALPFGLWLMKHTLLGNPLIALARPRRHHRRVRDGRIPVRLLVRVLGDEIRGRAELRASLRAAHRRRVRRLG